MRKRAIRFAITGMVLGGLTSPFLAPAGATSVPIGTTVVFVGTVVTSSSTPTTTVSFAFHAPAGPLGLCVDTGTDASAGSACKVDVTGTIAANSQCAGTGTAKFTYTSSVGNQVIFDGSLTLHQQGGAFVGALLPLGPVTLWGAHFHYTLSGNPCRPAGAQYPYHQSGTFAGAGAAVTVTIPPIS
jgi:hypothetical protein